MERLQIDQSISYVLAAGLKIYGASASLIIHVLKAVFAHSEYLAAIERDCFQTRLLSYVAIVRFSPSGAPLLARPLGVDSVCQAMAFVCQMGETSDERRPNSR